MFLSLKEFADTFFVCFDYVTRHCLVSFVFVFVSSGDSDGVS